MGATAAAAVTAAGQILQTGAGIWANNTQLREAQRARDWQTNERIQQNYWNLDQWNRDNSYNSPANQKALMEAAGFSPLAALDSNGQYNAASLESASAPGASMAHVSNPMAGFDASALARTFLEYKQMKLQEKKIDAESRHLDNDAQYKYELAETERQCRENKVTLGGVQIELGRSQTRHTDQDTKAIAQSITESNTRIEQMFQFCDESNVRMSLMRFQEYAMREKLPKEVRELDERIILTHNQSKVSKFTSEGLKHQNWSMFADNQIKYAYISNGYADRELHYNAEIKSEQMYQNRFQSKMMKGGVKSDANYTIDRGLDSFGKLIGPATNALQGFMYYSIGQSNYFKQMPTSSPNPTGIIMYDALGKPIK